MRDNQGELGLLKQVPLFEGMTTKDLKAVLAETKEEFFKTGDVIVAEGGTGGRFYLIVDGHAKVSVNGRSKVILGPGDYFGDLSVIDKGPRSATVAAQTDLRARSLSSYAFNALLDEYAGMSRKIMQELCRRVRSAENPPTA